MEPCLVDDSHPPTGLNPFSRRVSLRGLEGPKARLTLEGLSLRVNQLVPGCLWVPLRTKPCQVARFSPKRPSLAVRQILFDGFGGDPWGCVLGRFTQASARSASFCVPCSKRSTQMSSVERIFKYITHVGLLDPTLYQQTKQHTPTKNMAQSNKL